MKLEVESAVNFIIHILRLSENKISESKLSKFKSRLKIILCERYMQRTWDPNKPDKGRFWRMITNNHIGLDPSILKAGQQCGINKAYFVESFPEILQISVNPGDVTYSINNSGIHVLYEYNENNTKAWEPKYRVDVEKRKRKFCCIV